MLFTVWEVRTEKIISRGLKFSLMEKQALQKLCLLCTVHCNKKLACIKLNLVNLFMQLYAILTQINNSKSWNPKTLVGQPPRRNQGSFLYRDAKGYKTVLLDDNNGDHYNTLSMGHALHKQGLGVDYLNDTTQYPSISKGLTLYFRSRGQRNATKYGKSWKGFWWFTSGATWPNNASTDVLAHPYGACSNR